ncbi:hypothetical protein KRP22_002391 [Phytophthora ramorum]|nr:Lysosomal Pro-X carboxypeptidase [Phytophthora ramorum]
MEKTPILTRTHRHDSRHSRRHLLLAITGLLVTPALLLATVFNWKGSLAPVASDLVTRPLPTLDMDVTPTNLLSHCDERFFTQTLDHFDVGAPTYQQRYFVCDQHFRPGGVMFFYVGNEADVELYLNHTGLMWENAGEFGAMLVFAEHRYFGKSVPFGKDVTKHMRYLSTEQTQMEAVSGGANGGVSGGTNGGVHGGAGVSGGGGVSGSVSGGANGGVSGGANGGVHGGAGVSGGGGVSGSVSGGANGGVSGGANGGVHGGAGVSGGGGVSGSVSGGANGGVHGGVDGGIDGAVDGVVSGKGNAGGGLDFSALVDGAAQKGRRLRGL